MSKIAAQHYLLTDQYRDAASLDIIDAPSVPVDDNTFDAVIANHMLYHVPDRSKALSEMRRALRQDGKAHSAAHTSCR